MTTTLTPYDTGDVLEPHPWISAGIAAPPEETHRFGKVDFDDDEAHTRLTVHVTRHGDRHVLHISNINTDLAIQLENGSIIAADDGHGDRAVVLHR